NNQKLIGQGAPNTTTLAALTGVTVPTHSDALPGLSNNPANVTITTSAAATHAITVGQNNTLRGMTIGNTTGAKIFGSGFGTVTIGSPSGASDIILSGTGQALSLTNGTLAARIASITSDAAGTGILLDATAGSLAVTGGGSPATNITNSTGVGINVTDSNTGAAPTSSVNVDFGNTNVSSSTGTGVSLSNNSGTFTFADLDIAPDANARALHGTNNTGAVTTTSGTITASGATAVELNNSSGTVPLNIQFTTVNANGGTNGIKLFNTSSTGSPGGFRVLGNTSGNCGGTTGGTPTAVAIASNPADCSGGDIQGTTAGANQTHDGSGVSLTNAANVSLTRVRIRNHGNYGIRGTGGNSNFTLTNSLIDGANGNNTGGSFPESSILFDNVGGTYSITNSNVKGGFAHNIKVDNQTSTLNLTVTGCLIRDTNNSTNGDDGITLEAETTANLTATVNQNVFANHGGDHCNVTAINNAILNITFNNNTATGGHVSGVSQTGIFIFGSNYDGTAAAQDLTYSINNNNISGDASGGLIHVNKGAGSATFGGTVNGNTLSNSAASTGVRIEARGTGAHNAIVTNNTITNYNNHGILFEAGEGSAAINGTATGNNISSPGANALHGMYANIGVLAADTNQACMDWRNNIVPNAANEGPGGADLRLRQRFNTQIRVRNYTGAGDGSNMFNVMTVTNANNATSVVASSTLANFANTAGGAQCTQPTMPILVEDTGAPSSDDTNASATKSATDEGVTSRPFVSFPQQTAAAKTVTSQPIVVQPRVAATRFVGGANAPTGGSLPVNVGTLRPGDSVTITFQVTVNSAATLPAGTTQVSNQGSVSGGNFGTVQTDDSGTGAPNDATVTPIDFASFSIGNVSVAEGATGLRTVTLTVTLNQTSNTATSVQYATANGTATEPDDYVTVGLTTLNISPNTASANFTVQVKGDILREGNENFFVDLSNPTGNSAILDNQAIVTIADDEPQVADISGDGFTDAAIWNSNNGNWFVINSGTSTATMVADDWGRASLGDVAVPGDYDGDNKIDIAVFRVAEGNWYILQSSGVQPNILVENWGQTGDKAVPGDYDDDGKTDVAVYRPSEGKWYIKKSGGGTTAQNWGISTDKPVVGDFDGDGKTDLAVFRGAEGNWYI
ncbi:MAG: VCBS repeat-containing protein, partial [Pyrinomonadaceae bacterium]|nr:VCBS repeat-containing protein [Pyrinomonadaceae bacterium]